MENDWNLKTKRNDEEMNVFSDNGAKREIKKGKGRMDLIPLDVLKRINETYYNIMNPSNSYVLVPIFVDNVDVNDTLVEQEYLKTIIYITCMQYGEGDNKGDIRKFYSLLPLMLIDLSKQFEKGAEVYGERNCQMGLPNKSFIDSGLRHTCQWLAGQNDECHHIAAIWNLWMYDWNTHNEPLKPDTKPEEKSKLDSRIRFDFPFRREYEKFMDVVVYADDLIGWSKYPYDSADSILKSMGIKYNHSNTDAERQETESTMTESNDTGCDNTIIDLSKVIEENKLFNDWLTANTADPVDIKKIRCSVCGERCSKDIKEKDIKEQKDNEKIKCLIINGDPCNEIIKGEKLSPLHKDIVLVSTTHQYHEFLTSITKYQKRGGRKVLCVEPYYNTNNILSSDILIVSEAMMYSPFIPKDVVINTIYDCRDPLTQRDPQLLITKLMKYGRRPKRIVTVIPSDQMSFSETYQIIE